MVALLTGVVVVLVICHTPRTVINLYECYHVLYHGNVRHWEQPLWAKVVIKLSHLLLSVSSAVNIIIYSTKMSINFTFYSLDLFTNFARISSSDQLSLNTCEDLVSPAYSVAQLCRATQAKVQKNR